MDIREAIAEVGDIIAASAGLDDSRELRLMASCVDEDAVITLGALREVHDLASTVMALNDAIAEKLGFTGRSN